MGSASGRARTLGELVVASHRSTLEQLPELFAGYGMERGWPEVLIYVSDLQQTVLRLLTGEGIDAGRRSGGFQAEIPVNGTVPGRAFQIGKILPASQAGGRWWIPLLDGTERIGVLRVATAGGAAEGEAEGEETWTAGEPLGLREMLDLREMAALAAMLVVNKRVTSDGYARLVRRRRMNVAAEMEWRLMPPRTFAAQRAVISALMEPAYTVSGDVFDYAFSGEVVHLCVIDAMGHDVAAGLTANLALAAGRNQRRQGADLPQTADGIERVLIEQFGSERFATGVLADFHLKTGQLTWINRGHPPPVVIRGGRSAFALDCSPAPPMGMDLGLSAQLCHEQLQPGDRLLLHTDGITEARSPDGEEFGLERFADFLIRHHADGLPVPETLRRLIRHHLDYHQGHLNDDATVLVLEWHGPDPYPPGKAEALLGLPVDAEEQAGQGGRGEAQAAQAERGDQADQAEQAERGDQAERGEEDPGRSTDP